jgi:hypothetical protein
LPLYPNRPVAEFYHPVSGIGLCRAASHNLVIQALAAGDYQLADQLKRHFGFKRDLVLRAENVFYHELVKLVPELARLRRVLDETVLSKLLGKTKSLEDPRPDYFHLNETTNIGLHGEFDETDNHEDAGRLRVIAHHAGCGVARVYYFRVKGRLGTPEAVCNRIIKKDVACYRLTERGRDVLAEVAGYVRLCVSQMEAGVPPPASSGRDVDIRRF